jgi:DNA-directed RNA polymerase subunit RPC12/RpoP
MFGQNLQYFCLECGNELINIKVIDFYGCHNSSQECLKCGYTLLFGIIKKRSQDIKTTTPRMNPK